MLMSDPLLLELTTKPIQYKDSIFMPYSYKDRIFQQVQVNSGDLRLVIHLTIHKHIIGFIIFFLVVACCRGPIMYVSLIS